MKDLEWRRQVGGYYVATWSGGTARVVRHVLDGQAFIWRHQVFRGRTCVAHGFVSTKREACKSAAENIAALSEGKPT